MIGGNCSGAFDRIRGCRDFMEHLMVQTRVHGLKVTLLFIGAIGKPSATLELLSQ